jgi:hypothetical protein
MQFNDANQLHQSRRCVKFQVGSVNSLHKQGVSRSIDISPCNSNHNNFHEANNYIQLY